MADFDLGGLLFGNAPSSGLEGYLDPEQLRRMQQQGVMQAAMALLKASGPSTQRVGLGQALGGAYEAGQAGYQQAQQQGIAGLLTKQKLEEAARAQKMQENYAKMVAGLTGGQAPEMGAMTSESALAAPVTAQLPAGPTVARAEMIGQPPRSLGGPAIGGGATQRGNLSPQMAALLSQLPASAGIPELMKYMQPAKTVGEPFKGTDGNTYIRTETGGVIPFTTGVAPKTVGEPFKGADKQTYIRTETGDVIPFTTGVAAKPVGAPHQAMNAAGKAVLVQSYDDGSQQEISGLSPYEATPAEVKLLQAAGQPVNMANIITLRRSAATNVSVGEGQKGFENTMSLKKTFNAEPIYKDFNDMKSAYSQVLTSLDQGTPIGDVAGATKVMKLLDPGSVVRESELGIAMAASGRMDRLKNYFNNWATGQKLTPTQRDDFKQLSNELYAAAAQAYNQKRQEYQDYGQSFNLDASKALGAPAIIPSLMRGGPGGAERKPLGSIFQPR
jgi:hypothetical protein